MKKSIFELELDKRMANTVLMYNATLKKYDSFWKKDIKQKEKEGWVVHPTAD